MNPQFLMTFEDYKIVPVAFMVTEKQVLAMCGVYFLPILQSKFDGGKRRMMMGGEVYSMFFEKFLHFFCLFCNHVHLFD